MYELHLKPIHKISISIVCCLLSIVYSADAQNIKDSSLFIPMVKFSYSGMWSGGDMAKRFGFGSVVSLNFSIKTKRNLFFGGEGSFIFGDNVNETGILDSLMTTSGFIINQSGNPATVRIYERGFTASLHIGKLFSIGKHSKNSGVLVYAGPTYLWHWISIDDIGHQSPQLVDEYLKGYDRFTGGFGIHEFIGYTYFGSNRIINFFAGFDFTQAFTKSLRSYDYDLMRPDTQNRVDLLSGFRIGWILPLYRATPDEFYYH